MVKSLLKAGSFQAVSRWMTSAVFLAPGQPLTWQNFTSLLLLQRAWHNFRVIQREGRD